MPTSRFVRCLCGSLLGMHVLAAAQGDLDPSFGDQGVHAINAWIGSALSSGSDAVAQGDGKLLVLGTASIDGRSMPVVFRLLSDGALDTTFSGDGWQEIDFVGEDAGGVALALDSQGRVLVTARIAAQTGYDSDYGLARLRSDGSVDTGFADQGRLIHDVHGDYEAPIAIAVDAADRAIVLGEGRASGDNDPVVLRYTSGGAIDDSFAHAGVWTDDLGGSDYPSGLAIDAEGRILIGGQFKSRSSFVLRLSADGTRDTSFGNTGMSEFQASASKVASTGDLALAADGGILWTGLSWDSGRKDTAFGIAKLNAAGALDTGFGSDGIVKHYLGGQAMGWSLQPQADGTVVLLGMAAGDGMTVPAALRVLADGSADPSFGQNGRVYFDAGSVAGGAMADGRTFLVGSFSPATNQPQKIWVAGLDAGGSPDAAWGDNGVLALAPTTSSSDRAAALLRQADGALLLVGTASIGRQSRIAVLRRLRDGRADTTWAGDGCYLWPAVDAAARDALLQADGKLLVLTDTRQVFRLDRNGNLDVAFGDQGVADLPEGSYNGLGQDSQGRILVVGSRANAGNVNNRDLLVTRLRADGSPDAGFEDVHIDSKPGAFSHKEQLHAVAVRSDDSLICVGEGGPSDSAFLLMRITAEGQHDTGFGSDGFILMPELSASNWDTSARDCLVLDDDRVLVVGAADDQARQGRLAAVMLGADNRIDTAFGDDGTTLLDVDDGAADRAWDVCRHGDGFLVAGTASDIQRSDMPETAVLMYLDAAGAPVAGFGQDGGASYHSGLLQAAAGVVSDGTYAYLGGHGARDLSLARLLLGSANGQAPVIAQGDSVHVVMDEDGSPTAFSLRLDASDADDDQLAWSIAVAPDHGAADVGSGTGSSQAISYQPDADFNGTDRFTVLVSDGLLSDSIVVDVTIDPQPDDPGGQPELQLTHAAHTVQDGGRIDGPTLRLGGSAAAIELMVANTGDANLLLNGITVVQETNCTVQSDALPSALAPGASSVWRVTIGAASAGDYEASLRLTSNDSDEGSLSFIISGTASAAPPVVRRIRLLLRDGAGEGLPFQADPDRPEASVEHEQGTAIIRLDDHILDVRIGLMPIQGTG
ncbi:MAG: Ig-like domain-containing protein [Planctomycetota bacterium]